jgi:hypothetical protein
MKISAKDAGILVGMTKAGIIKAIIKGSISAEKDHNGQWKIDPSELTRVYPPVNQNSTNQDKQNKIVYDGLSSVDSGLQEQIKLMREQINDLREQVRRKDDLLDTSNTEKEKLLKMIDEQISTVRLLTDQGQGREQKKGFLGKLFG